MKFLRLADGPEVCHTGAMPKRTSKRKRPKDVSEWAHQIVSESTKDGESTPEQISKIMSEMGKRGGKIGGKRRLETMTPEERRNASAHAARARWARVKGKP